MRPLSKKHARILKDLTSGLDESGCRRIDNAEGIFLAVVVERIGPNRFSIAHYYEQNGDLVPDPDFEFVTRNGEWFPAAVTHAWGSRRCLKVDDNGRITGLYRLEYVDLREFARVLLTNIKKQQGKLAP